MEIRWTLVASLLIFGLVLHELMPVCAAEEADDTTKDVQNESETDTEPVATRRPFMRRRVVRKRIINGDKDNAKNSSANVSVSMSVTTVEGDTEKQPEKGFRRPFTRVRSSFMNRTRPTFMTTPVGIPTTADPMETPNTSFKLKMRPRLPFGRLRTTPNSILEDETDGAGKLSGKTEATAKPFVRKNFFRDRTSTTPEVTSTTTRTTTTTTTEEPTLEDLEDDNETDDEGDADDDEGESETVQESIKSEISSKSPSTTSSETATSNKNSSMIIIPVPPGQRKPYHPVIMQVTKTPTTAESLPETKVITYKLNKMFVPMGIYGKVLPKSASAEDKEMVSRPTHVSTPLPFLLSGQDDKKKVNKSEKPVDAHRQLKTPRPEIKVKGHRSKEVAPEEQMTSADSSHDYASAVAYANNRKEHHIRQLRQWESMMEKLKEKHRKNIVDTISLTYDQKPALDQISLTTEKINIGDISLTTERNPYPPNRLPHPMWGNLKQQEYMGPKNGMQHDRPPPPNRYPHPQPPSPTKSIFQTITSAASSIPGLIQSGLTSLTSQHPSPFEDETFSSPSHSQSQGQSQSQTVYAKPPQFSSLPSSKPNPTIPSEAETLEFFRKRPYLLNGRNLDGRDNFLQPEYSSGFKPVTAPVHFASQYYASTPKHSESVSSTTPATVMAYFAEQREPLHKDVSNWLIPSSTERSPKQLDSLNDIYSWRAASSLHSTKQQHPFSGFGFSTTTARPSFSLSPSTPVSFSSQWLDFNRKYTKSEIEDAKDRIFNMFAGTEPQASFDSMMYMKPPIESKQSANNGGAFDDLLKMFRMGFNFGVGHTSSDTPMVKYSAGMYNEDNAKSASTTTADGWKPLTKPGSNGTPMISLNAGITFPGKPTSSPMFGNLLGSGSHYSSSTKPYLPKSTYKEFFNPKAHYASQNSHYSGTSPTKAPYSIISTTTPSEYLSSYYNHYKSPESSYHFNSKPSFGYTSTLRPETASKSYFKSSDLRPLALGSGSESYYPNAFSGIRTSHGHQYSNDPAIEIIPSSVFFKQKGNMADIAAIIKPPELSSDLVKAALPPQIASVPQLSYPTQQLIQNPHSFTSLSQLQQYFATAQPTPQPSPTTPFYNPLALQHLSPHHQIPAGQFMYLSNGKIIHQSGIPQQHQYQQHLQPASHLRHSKQPVQSSQGGVKSAGDPSLGFSDFELPAGLDPDIASLIKTELDKDDVPEEYRQDFAKAKEEEEQKKQSQNNKYQQSASASSMRVTVLKPHESNNKKDSSNKNKNHNHNHNHNNDNSNRRSDNKSKLDIKFHKPVPITPTMLTPTKGKSIRASPVPRYVVELARKLKSEKDVQGIVRVSTKRERGPPIEYLYPVRG